MFAERVYDPVDWLIENGLIRVQDGKIVSVTPGAKPPGDALRAYAVTPGLIDASVRITSGAYSVEQSSEVTPGVRVADSLDPFSPGWDRQVRHGVTTALVSPPDENVIGGLGVVLKTGGPESISARTVKPDAVLRGSMGTQPSGRNHPAFGRPTDFYSRRPTTRMGVEWEWRKAMYDAATDPSSSAPELVRHLKSLLIPDVAGALLTAHAVDQQLYVETRFAPSGGISEPALMRRLSDAVQSWPGWADEFIVQSVPDPSWRLLASRLPSMMRFVVEQTRFGISDGAVIANMYLPRQAVPQVTLATLLAMNTRAGAAGEVVAAPTAKLSVEEMLAR
ncbi:MAG: hypothetical protein AAF408_09945, partial [Pseudomonadota bacterium]